MGRLPTWTSGVLHILTESWESTTEREQGNTHRFVGLHSVMWKGLELEIVLVGGHRDCLGGPSVDGLPGILEASMVSVSTGSLCHC